VRNRRVKVFAIVDPKPPLAFKGTLSQWQMLKPEPVEAEGWDALGVAAILSLR
jgi:hypothetical protein